MQAWEVVGETFHDTVCSVEMADAIQVYLDTVNAIRTEFSMWYCEFKIASDLHPLFYGTLDFGDVNMQTATLHIVDYKHGQGIVVEPEHNPQLMYYAYGMLQHHEYVRHVKMTIVQPRAYHADGVVRTWECSAEEIIEWAEKTLFPAMQRAEIDEQLDAGPWCRFCPAKLACPLLAGLFKAAAMINPKIIPNLSDEALGRDYKLREAVKFYLKAQDDEMFRRLSAGKEIAEAKLVHKRADRVLKEGAEPVFKEKFGDEIYTKPELKTPAQLEKLGASAKELVKEYAYMPQTGFTVALADDKRMAVKMQTTTQAFGATIKQLTEEANASS
jgi:Protein of unknown function (DUF2800)